MKMNIGAWLGIGGGLAGILIAIASVIMTVPGNIAIYIVAGMIIFFGGMILLFWKLLFGPMVNNARLQKDGVPGKATITNVADTGVTINDSPQVKLTLELKNLYGQRYTTTCRVLVSRINPSFFQPGMEVAVKIDPKNELNVVIAQ